MSTIQVSELIDNETGKSVRVSRLFRSPSVFQVSPEGDLFEIEAKHIGNMINFFNDHSLPIFISPDLGEVGDEVHLTCMYDADRYVFTGDPSWPDSYCYTADGRLPRMASQFSRATLKKIAAGTWVMYGDLVEWGEGQGVNEYIVHAGEFDRLMNETWPAAQ